MALGPIMPGSCLLAARNMSVAPERHTVGDIREFPKDFPKWPTVGRDMLVDYYRLSTLLGDERYVAIRSSLCGFCDHLDENITKMFEVNLHTPSGVGRHPMRKKSAATQRARRASLEQLAGFCFKHLGMLPTVLEDILEPLCVAKYIGFQLARAESMGKAVRGVYNSALKHLSQYILTVLYLKEAGQLRMWTEQRAGRVVAWLRKAVSLCRERHKAQPKPASTPFTYFHAITATNKAWNDWEVEFKVSWVQLLLGMVLPCKEQSHPCHPLL